MWFRVDDGALQHAKFWTAAQHLGGRNAFARVFTVWAAGGVYASTHNHLGLITRSALDSFIQFDRKPREVARALVAANLWEINHNGYSIHDFNVYNPDPTQVQERRAHTRERTQAWRRRKRDTVLPL